MPRQTRTCHILIIFLALWIAVAWVSAGETDAPRPLRLLRINPSGEDVRPGNQIVFQFDRAVVPLGRMDRKAEEIPIDIDPDPGCHWRWIDTSTLACNLDGDSRLGESTRYRIEIGTGIEAEDGGRLGEGIEHSFVTRRPRVIHYWFDTWTSPGTPVIHLTFNQEVERDSVAGHTEFRFGPGGKIPASAKPTGDDGRSWYVRPARELPLDANIVLAVFPGVRSRHGNEPGVENRTVVRFHTIPSHRFMGLQCRSNGGERVRIHPGEMQRDDRRCNPLEQVALVFSSPVQVGALRDHLVVEPDLAGGREDYDPWEGYPEHSRLGRYRPDDGYHFWLPEVLSADTEYRVIAKAADLVDEFGRELEADIEFRFRTDDRKPDLNVTHTTSSLESEVGTHLPVVVTNLDRITARFSTLTGDGRRGDQDREVKLPEVKNVAFRHPLPVRDWLGGKPGAISGRLNTDPSVYRHPRWFFTTVSPYQVHVKLGHYNTLVWVTDLVTGRPVRGAAVEITERVLEDLADTAAVKAAGRTNRHGTAVLPGAETLDPERERTRHWWGHSDKALFITVSKGSDFGVMPLIGGFRIDNRGQGGNWISTDNQRKHGHIRTWGTTAQGIYRAGDTVEYKIWIRDERNERLEPAPPGRYLLKVIDPTGKTAHERKEIELNEFGAFHGSFTVPETAAVGWYSFRLNADYAGARTWGPLSVLVSDFTPAPFRVLSTLNAERFHDGEEVEVETAASLHSGGPYVEARSRVTAVLSPQPFRPDDPVASGFRFDTGVARAETIHQGEAALDSEGRMSTRFAARSGSIIHGRLDVESAVRDDRGKYIAGRSSARFAARDRFVGIRQDDWVLQAGKDAEVLALVTDEYGKPAAGTKIEFTVERRKTTATRVKGAGNAYLTEYTHSWEAVDQCTETSAAEPVSCSFTPSGPGSFRLVVDAQDTNGRPVRSETYRWAAGRGVVLWESPPGHELSIVPEKTSLRVGDRARYLVKNPFPGARALVTVERYGVIKSWMEVLKDSTAIVEFPVEPDFLPGYHLSVTVMSPRVEDAPADGKVDLGKPAFRTGYVRVEVRDPYKELEIEASADRETYRPGDTVNLEIGARTKQGDVPGMEYAVAVLDEAVLDLLAGGASRFDPYAGFYSLRSLDVLNYNILKNLIGIQKFEKKGANPGGGGSGPDARMRSNFRFVSYWNPSIRPDRKGKAKVSFQVPDNLTGWRVLVLAATPGDRFGLGQERFTVNRPTEIRPALPNQVVEGDRFEARFTVMNRTGNRRTLEVVGSAEGSVKGEPVLKQSVEAEPYKRRVVSVPVTSRGPGEIRFRIRAGDAADADGLVASVPVRRMVAMEVGATYGSTVEPSVVEPVKFPEGIRTDVGSLSLVAGPTVISGLEGAFGYMRDYPYICWEQKLSKAVMAAHYLGLRRYLDPSLEWPGADALVKRTLELAANHQTPRGGMAYYVPRDEYTSPYLSAYTALAFRWLRDQGYEIPSGVEQRLQEYLLGILRRDAHPEFYSKGMASTVRAVALAALAPAGKITLADLERYRRHLPQMDLFGRAHFLQAAQRLGAGRELISQVTDSILSHANETGGKLAFVEDLDNGYTRILHSSLRTRCAILESTAVHDDEHLKDISYKLVRSIVQTRGRRYHWENTQENLFCTRAVLAYSRAFEQEEPDFTLEAGIDGEPLGEAAFRDFRDEPVRFDRPIAEGDPGRRTEVKIEKDGPGRLYYALRLAYSPVEPPTDRINAGIDVRREYSVEREGGWTVLGNRAELKQGELVRVDLYLHLPAPRNFVVVDDPVPGGLEPVNRDLATASAVDAGKAVNTYPPDAFYYTWSGWRTYGYTRWSFYHRELRHDSVRFYSDYLPAGRYHLSYVAQVIAPGEFRILPLRAEEMYDPDVYGRGASGLLLVQPSEQ